MICVSTGGFNRQTAAQTVSDLLAVGLEAIELSGGMYSPSFREDLLDLRSRARFQVHNYFPPPERAFVFNLATLNPAIAEASLAHAKRAMRLAADLGAGFYSFHAGYLVDPQPSELGQPLENRRINDRKKGLAVFLERVAALAEEASGLGLELLIENNVLSEGNWKRFGADPLLMTTPTEAAAIFESVPENVRMLLDVAHLKVSARTLAFDPVSMMRACEPRIRAYHLSENDGLSDSNEPLREDSWFWPHLPRGAAYYSLEVYSQDLLLLKAQAELTAAKLGHPRPGS